ncbi:MAG: hypothetical protein IIB07_01000 [Bacteroidetes bacterium]|nr:hypothetical protein [Bacteroidota bacterium]
MKFKYNRILSFVLLLPLFISSQENIKNKNYNKPDYAKTVADKYGLENFSKVKSIAFTFNVQFKKNTRTRKWLWDVKNKTVTYWGPDKDGKPIEFQLKTDKKDKNKDEKVIDSRFINDQYWLLFPFHLIWDKKAIITDKGNRKAPISKKNTRCLIVQYPKDAGGYTPGDIFELYTGKDNLIQEWVYRPGGSTKTKFPISWENHKNFNGIIISTKHIGKARDFKLWFTDISVVLE